MLHMINKTNLFDQHKLSTLQVIKPEDALLFLADGVYLLHNTSPKFEKLQQYVAIEQIYALTSDIAARGLEQLISKEINQIHYDGFVTLTEQYHPSMTW